MWRKQLNDQQWKVIFRADRSSICVPRVIMPLLNGRMSRANTKKVTKTCFLFRLLTNARARGWCVPIDATLRSKIARSTVAATAECMEYGSSNSSSSSTRAHTNSAYDRRAACVWALAPTNHLGAHSLTKQLKRINNFVVQVIGLRLRACTAFVYEFGEHFQYKYFGRNEKKSFSSVPFSSTYSLPQQSKYSPNKTKTWHSK